MDALKRDDVYTAVMSLWPRAKLSPEEFQVKMWPRLRNYGVDVILEALKRQGRQSPDATRAEWEPLFRDLAGTSDGSGSRPNDFQVLLSQVRRALQEHGVKGVDEWSDADVFQNHCEANPGRAPGILRGWLEYFREDLSETPPGFLVE